MRTEEEGTSENERSALVSIAPKKTLVAPALLSGTVGVVELTMLNLLAISTSMLRSGRNRLALLREDAGLIHVVPGVVDVS